MANQYFIWKDANCNGKDPVWIELSGEEFLKFIEQPENSHRKFVKEYFDEERKYLGFYKFEVNEENFRKLDAKRKKDERSEDVLVANQKKKQLSDKDDVDGKVLNSIPTVVSFDAPLIEDEETNLHDIVPDGVNAYEEIESSLLIDDLRRASRSFSKSERKVLDWVVFNNPENKTETQIATEHNVSQQYINKTMKKIIKKFKKVGC